MWMYTHSDIGQEHWEKYAKECGGQNTTLFDATKDCEGVLGLSIKADGALHIAVEGDDQAQ